MTRRLLLLSLGIAVGCTHAPVVQSPLPVAAPAAAATRSQSLDRLAEDVDALGVPTSELTQPAVAKVLKELGRSLEPISHASNLRVQEVAQRLGGAPAHSLSQAGLLKQGLDLVLKALVPFASPPGREKDYRKGLQGLSQAIQAVQDLLPFVEQRERTNAALQAAVDAIFLARGGEPPFGIANQRETPPLRLRPTVAQLEEARGDVSKLARAKMLDSSTAAANALTALADMLATTETDAKLNALIAEARFQAERLERASTVRFGQAGWVRSGLIAVLDGLDLVQHGPANAPCPWSQVARAAVVGIDAHSSLVFQRAVIQDAFRATVDALTIAAERPGEHTCAESGG